MKSRYLSLCGLIICLSFTTVHAQEFISADSLSKAIRKIDVEEELIRENEQLRHMVDSLDRGLNNWRYRALAVIDDSRYEIKLYQLLYAIETAKNVNDGDTYKRFGKMLTVDYKANGEVDKLYIRADSYYLDAGYADKKSLKYRLFQAIEGKSIVSSYPVTSRLIIQQKLLLKDTTEVGLATVDPMGIRRIEFPQLSSKAIPLEEKQRKADQLLNFIMTVSGSKPFERYSFPTYQSLEKKEVPNNDINKLLKIRYSYILYLKKQYEKM